MISAIIDIVALALIVLCTILGFRRGFAKTFVSTFGILLSLIFAILLSGVTAKFLESQFSWTTKISQGLTKSLSSVFGNDLMQTTIEQASSTTLTDAGLSGIIVKMILGIKSGSTISPDVTVGQAISSTFAYYITVLIAILILYILFRIALFLLSEIVFKAHKFKLIKGVDKTLGALLGVIRGIIIVQIIILIVDLLPFNFFNTISVAISKSAVAGFISRINIFKIIVSAIADTSYIVSLIPGL